MHSTWCEDCMYDLFLLFFFFRSACHTSIHMTSSEDLTISNKTFCLFPVTLLPSGALGMTSSEDLTIPNKMFCLFPVTLLPSGALGMTSSKDLTIPNKMFCLFPVTLLLSGALSQAGFNLFLTPFLGRVARGRGQGDRFQAATGNVGEQQQQQTNKKQQEGSCCHIPQDIRINTENALTPSEVSKQPASSQYAIPDSILTQKWNTRGVDRAELLVVFLEMVSVELMGFFQGSDVLVRHLLSNSKEVGWLEGAAATSERSSLRHNSIVLCTCEAPPVKQQKSRLVRSWKGSVNWVAIALFPEKGKDCRNKWHVQYETLQEERRMNGTPNHNYFK